MLSLCCHGCCLNVLLVSLPAHRRMIERLVRVVEIVFFSTNYRLKQSYTWTYARHTRHVVRSPWVQHVKIVLRRVHLAQVLNAVVMLVAVDMVYLLHWKAALADRPDSMVQKNKNMSLVQRAKHA